MKKSAIVLFFSALLTISAFAQSVQDGVGHLFAERYTSAKGVFEKMVGSNPNNLDAVYWLGQTYIAQDNVAGARQVYEKALAANGNAPIVLVGMGHVELLEGKTNEARQRFETAISLSRGKKGNDAMVLNAIGRANVDSPKGDMAYAIEKLNQAAAVAPNNGEIFINLGNAYRKAKDGGQAIVAYRKAIPTHPALAYYRMARVYETQRNWDIVTENLDYAIKADPKFAPAFLRQYVYNLFHKQDYAAADEWAKKYIAVADPSVENEYFRAQALYQQKNYDQAIQVGQSILSQSKDVKDPSVYRLMAYSYLEKGDTTTAKQYVDQLFTKADKEDFVAKDYTLKADIYSKENPDEVVQIYLDAASEDTTLRNKLLILQEAVEWARTANRKIPEADLRLQLYRLNPNRNPAVLIGYVVVPYYQGGAFKKADSVAREYSQSFPDSVYGYLWSARSLARLDSEMKDGLAIPQYEQLLAVSEKDKVRFKPYGMEAAGSLANYYVNIKGDRDKGVFYLRKGLEFDPENTSFKGAIEKLTKSSGGSKQSAAAPKSSSSSKVKTDGSTTKIKKD
ncbi:MAG TPA: tetratricopeptide repeat protein [Chitinophagaceae bacterium]